MEDKYKGESPSKKQARFLYWVEVMKRSRVSGHDRFFEGHHMILASREGGDISTLYGLGVEPKYIVAVERNPSAAFAVQEKYPDVRVVCSDAVRIAKEYRRKLASAYLDFCGSLTDKLIDDIFQVVQHGLKDEAMLGVTVLSGREKGELRLAMGEEKQKLQDPEDRFLKHFSDEDVVLMYQEMARGKTDEGLRRLYARTTEILQSGDPARVKEEANRIRQQHIDGYEEAGSAIARLHFLTRELQRRLNPFRVLIHPVTLFSYTSSTDKSKGVPMAVVLFKVARLNKKLPMDRFYRKLLDATVQWGFTNLQDCNADMRDLRRQVLSYLRFLDKEHSLGKYAESTILTATTKSALLWNLPEETITAWKAHQTRGTYEDE